MNIKYVYELDELKLDKSEYVIYGNAALRGPRTPRVGLPKYMKEHDVLDIYVSTSGFSKLASKESIWSQVLKYTKDTDDPLHQFYHYKNIRILTSDNDMIYWDDQRWLYDVRIISGYPFLSEHNTTILTYVSSQIDFFKHKGNRFWKQRLQEK